LTKKFILVKGNLCDNNGLHFSLALGVNFEKTQYAHLSNKLKTSTKLFPLSNFEMFPLQKSELNEKSFTINEIYWNHESPAALNILTVGINSATK